MLRIDSHQHFWQRSLPFDYRWLEKPGMEAICRDYLPEHLEPLLGAAGIDGSVFVQTQHNVAENRWVLELADRHSFLLGIVGWVDLASPDCERQLEEFVDHPRFVGIRHVVQDEPDDDFIIRPEIMRGLGVLERHGVPYDLLFYVKHLRHVPALARAFPRLPMVIDHLSKPRIREQVREDWLPHLQAAARFPNVFCKLSGMVTEADHQTWKVADLKPYVEAALEAFGPHRCMYGSDWPVCELAASYGQVHDALQQLLGTLTHSEQERIWGGTAIEFYGLQTRG